MAGGLWVAGEGKEQPGSRPARRKIKRSCVLLRLSCLRGGSSTEGKGEYSGHSGDQRPGADWEQTNQEKEAAMAWAGGSLRPVGPPLPGRPHQHCPPTPPPRCGLRTTGRVLSLCAQIWRGRGGGWFDVAAPGPAQAGTSVPGLPVLPGHTLPPLTAPLRGAPGPAQLSRVGTCAVPASARSSACPPRTSSATGLDAPSWSLGAARRKS